MNSSLLLPVFDFPSALLSFLAQGSGEGASFVCPGPVRPGVLGLSFFTQHTHDFHRD